MDTQSKIYAELESLASPAYLPAPWHDWPAPAGYRALPRNLRAAASDLLQKFTPEQLVAAGILTAKCNCQETVSMPGLTVSELAANVKLLARHALFLRRDPGGLPCEVVTTWGCLSGRQPPLLAALDDRETQVLLENGDDSMFATSTVEDAAVLRSLGHAAVPAAGLETLAGESLDRFCRVFGVRSLNGLEFSSEDDDEEVPEAEFSDESAQALGASGTEDDSKAAPSPTASGTPHPFSPPGSDSDAPAEADSDPENWADRLRFPLALQLVGWHPSELLLAAPSALAKVQAHLRALAMNLDLLIDQVWVWQPDVAELETFRYALVHATAPHLKGLFSTSLRGSSKRVNPPPRELSPTCHSAFDVLLDKRAEADYSLQFFRQLVQQQFLGPLLTSADGEKDLTVKTKLMAQTFALHRDFDMLAKLVVAARHKRRGQFGADDASLGPNDVEKNAAFDKTIESIMAMCTSSKPRPATLPGRSGLSSVPAGPKVPSGRQKDSRKPK